MIPLADGFPATLPALAVRTFRQRTGLPSSGGILFPSFPCRSRGFPHISAVLGNGGFEPFRQNTPGQQVPVWVVCRQRHRAESFRKVDGRTGGAVYPLDAVPAKRAAIKVINLRADFLHGLVFPCRSRSSAFVAYCKNSPLIRGFLFFDFCQCLCKGIGNFSATVGAIF